LRRLFGKHGGVCFVKAHGLLVGLLAARMAVAGAGFLHICWLLTAAVLLVSAAEALKSHTRGAVDRSGLRESCIMSMQGAMSAMQQAAIGFAQA
jgi:hypothetical protein